MTNCLIELRRARQEDSHFLMDIYNHPDINKLASIPHIVSIQEHKLWFMERLHSAHSFIYIAFKQDNAPFGYIRFEEKDGAAILSIAILPRWQNNGFGLSLIAEGCRKLLEEITVYTIIAHVRSDNTRALHVFEKVGFLVTGTISQNDIKLVELSLDTVTFQRDRTMETI
jgi:RimJ/RimL family protein N-acetyltransferase